MVVSAAAIAAYGSAAIQGAVELVVVHGFWRGSDSMFALASVMNWRIVKSGFDSIAQASRPIILSVCHSFASMRRATSSRSCSISVFMVFLVRDSERMEHCFGVYF